MLVKLYWIAQRLPKSWRWWFFSRMSGLVRWHRHAKLSLNHLVFLWHAPLWAKPWLLLEDIFAKWGNLTDHGDDGVIEETGKIGPFHLLAYRGQRTGYDSLFIGSKERLRSRNFYFYEWSE